MFAHTLPRKIGTSVGSAGQDGRVCVVGADLCRCPRRRASNPHQRNAWRACTVLQQTHRQLGLGTVQKRKPWPPTVFVLGGPGSGKGTQCKRLAEELNWATVCVGELLREEATLRCNEPRGAYLEHLLSRGEIVPGHITLELLLERCASFAEELLRHSRRRVPSSARPGRGL
ncbi:bifunctional uridylate/adenylate kinase [Cyanidiococcus yangmingshanensis]|uniref:Bifunctional uridylate/adenylate kinase n=1 Tax=Cyanidiococcus yangmingshanensis TaxID=2690220 RepID=A0A7J7II97_9RHOD|nr:bifunctional uridylate/adenylate kinase [Cyanidiococcus yangmingshanensis]